MLIVNLMDGADIGVIQGRGSFGFALEAAESLRACFAAADQPLRDIATAMIDGGFRPEEVFRFSWPHVHFKPAGKARFGYIYNPFGKTKNAKRNVSLTQRLRSVLEMRWEKAGRPADGWVFANKETAGDHYDSMKSEHARALKNSTVAHFVLYSLRHTMLTRLGEAGADAFTIMKIAGHASIVTSARYVHPTDERTEGAFTHLEDYTRGRSRNCGRSRRERARGPVSRQTFAPR